MSYGHTPEGGDGRDDVSSRPSSSGTVYGSAGSHGAARVSSGDGRSSGTVYGSGTTYGSRSSSRGTTYGSGVSSSGTTYGSSASGRGTTYGSSAGTTYGSSASNGTTYGSSSGAGTTYGSAAVGDGPSGVGPRSRAATLAEDGLQPQFGGLPTPSTPRGKRRLTRKKVFAGIGIVTAVGVLLGLVGGGVAWASTDLPDIPQVSSTTRFTYSDGKTTFATFAAENRVEVKLDQVPKHVQDAVIAVEDPDFRDNSGVSFRGTARAVWGLVSGNSDAGGGSTITQQYIRNALNLTRGRSYTRKVKEIILARKLSDSMSKEDILIGYLNTIYFGRGAWGIQSASKAYFNKDVKNLSIAEGAVLAAVIKDPTNFDPSIKLSSAQGRWTYVLDQMQKKSFLTQAQRAAQVYPTKTIMKEATRTGAWRSGSTGVLGYRVEQELAKLGFDEQALNTGGLTVKTTISAKAQRAAKAASTKYVNSKVQDKQMATAMASIDPQSGAVRAYYGGERGYRNLDLASTAASHPAGSSFKPYVLAKGIEDGYSIDSKWDGTSGQTFSDRSTPLQNSDGDNSCGRQCSLTTATVKSLNTVYWALTLEVGAKKVAALAEKAGIRTLDEVPIAKKAAEGINSGIGIGQYSVSVLDQAAGYATFANYGVYRQPYFVEQIIDADGTVVWDHNSHVAPETQAFSRDVGRDVSYVLQQVYNSGRKQITDGREGAVKTGTQQLRDTDENAHAWMCGYTPQMATAVWVGSGGKDIALRDKANGNIHVYGSGIPGSIWRDYMSATMKGVDEVDFESPARYGQKDGNAPSEEPAPAPSDVPSTDDENPDLPWWQQTQQPSTDTTDGGQTSTGGPGDGPPIGDGNEGPIGQ